MLHVYAPLPPYALMVTELPLHNKVVPALIEGADGVAEVLITRVLLLPEVPQLLEEVAV